MPPRRGHPPSEFLLPNGTKVLVTLPDEVESLRKRYAHTAHADPPIQVEVVVHGSEQHRDLLHQTKSHHETRRQRLRERDGVAQVLEEWEEVRAQLEGLEAQLLKIAKEEYGVGGVNANFDKFGFHAKLRTYGEGEGEEDGEEGDGMTASSSGVSSYSGTTEGKGEAGEAMKLFQRPVIKQYFHRGLLWRSAENTEIMSFELFFDLLYVGIIAINGDHAAEESDGRELIRFIVTFCMSWRIWSDVQQVVSWFQTDDILQRVEIIFLISCLLGHTTNIIQAFHAGQDSYTQMVAFYLAARLAMAIYYAATAFLLPLVKGTMVSEVLNILVGAALWIASTTGGAGGEEGGAESPLNVTRIVLAFVALAVDLFGKSVSVALFRYGSAHETPLALRFRSWFEFFPAINIEHKVERTNAFVSLVFGYSVVGIMFQNTGAFAMPLNAFLGKAILGLTQAAVFNWLYFDIDGSTLRVHAIRRSVQSSLLWQWSHLPFSMAYILAAAALCKMVVLRDSAATPLDGLTEVYQERSAATLSLGLRLYYCEGLGLALFCMGLIALSHEHKVPAGQCRLPKWARLMNRFAVCVVFCCLPAAGTALNSLGLIAITTALSVWTLLFELWAKSCRESSYWGEDGDDAACRRYTASCSRKRLERATKENGEIDIVQLGRSEKTATATIA
ncbi:uncharacterized protein C8A04DRAFT_12290 [Dichotomopilus funicola]|uniref:Low temperature requirement A n=1 Tax=Dichotomopilus funicola TaxID=1934379 RepID=A0AAN6V4Y6_9PEZI|nr:hypothetical protein C8A04DRAFT_12290 [Dichotomopilus funicola]